MKFICASERAVTVTDPRNQKPLELINEVINTSTINHFHKVSITETDEQIFVICFHLAQAEVKWVYRDESIFKKDLDFLNENRSSYGIIDPIEKTQSLTNLTMFKEGRGGSPLMHALKQALGGNHGALDKPNHPINRNNILQMTSNVVDHEGIYSIEFTTRLGDPIMWGMSSRDMFDIQWDSLKENLLNHGNT